MIKHKPIEEYSLAFPPPEGHPDLGRWIWNLFEASYAEKERLGLMDRWVQGYKMFRGNHWGNKKVGDSDKISINLLFANIQRTVANITAKNPVVEVVDLDGYEDGIDQVLSTKMRKYWHQTEQQAILARTCLANEIYGITIEKHGWSPARKEPFSVVIDPYSFFPAPNCPMDIQEAPFLIHAYAMDVNFIEKKFKATDVIPDDVRTILGRNDREEVMPNATMQNKNAGLVYGNQADSMDGTSRVGGSLGEGLVIECWIKDYSTTTEIIEFFENNEFEGEIVTKKPIVSPKYPDGIRVITITNRGDKILSDMINPNINLELDYEEIEQTYTWGKFPFSKTNSYDSLSNIWGFSAEEQVGDLNKKIDEIVSKMVAYVNRALFPPLIIEKGAGITKSMIHNKPNLVIMPTRPNARIEFMPVPNLPSNFFDILNVLTTFHDRIYQIEDADRGVQPTGVTAASAIVALQERNAVLIQHKIRAMEYIARERGRFAIAFMQNFSTTIESIEVNGELKTFQGITVVGRKFNYLVESGSTVARTSIQQQEQAVSLYKLNAIDRQALLETLNFPNWKTIIERVGEGQLDQAIQILVQAGMPEEEAGMLKQFLLEPQTGTDKENQSQERPTAQPKPGIPKAQQG